MLFKWTQIKKSEYDNKPFPMTPEKLSTPPDQNTILPTQKSPHNQIELNYFCSLQHTFLEGNLHASKDLKSLKMYNIAKFS